MLSRDICYKHVAALRPGVREADESIKPGAQAPGSDQKKGI